MVNGQSKPQEPPQGLTLPPSSAPLKVLTCHRFYAPVVFPEPDRLDSRKASITPRLGNFNCIGAACTLWNARSGNPEGGECRDVTDSKSRAIIAEYAFNKTNDVHIQGGGL